MRNPTDRLREGNLRPALADYRRLPSEKQCERKKKSPEGTPPVWKKVRPGRSCQSRSGYPAVRVEWVFCLHKYISLYERASRSRLTLREEGQVELSWGETPNGLSASASLANGD